MTRPLLGRAGLSGRAARPADRKRRRMTPRSARVTRKPELITTRRRLYLPGRNGFDACDQPVPLHEDAA